MIKRELPAGAKYAVIGEHKLEVKHACPNCYNEDEGDRNPECEICGGECDELGCYTQMHVIPWDMQKDIWEDINASGEQEDIDHDRKVIELAISHTRTSQTFDGEKWLCRVEDLREYADNIGKDRG